MKENENAKEIQSYKNKLINMKNNQWQNVIK